MLLRAHTVEFGKREEKALYVPSNLLHACCKLGCSKWPPKLLVFHFLNPVLATHFGVQGGNMDLLRGKHEWVSGSLGTVAEEM